MNGIERPTIFMEESATNDQVADVPFPVNVNLTSTLQQRPTQPVHHHASAFCEQSSSVTRKLKPEENDEASAVARCANRQSVQSDEIPVQNAAASSSTHLQLSPDSQGACKATIPGSASWRHPQQETGQPPKDTHEHHGGGRGQLQFPAVNGLGIQSESRGNVIPMIPLEPALSLHSYEPLSSALARKLAISVSLPKDACNTIQERNIEDVPLPAPDLPCLWDAGTLAAFDDLRDFTSEESRLAAQALGLCEELPQNIRQFMMAFAELKAAKEKLWVLAEKLKEARMDVVDAMRCQTSLLPHLGPRMPEKHCIKDVTHSWRLPFTTALSTEHPTGHDWKWLAEYLKVPPLYINNWEQRERNPAEMVLSHWQGKISEATVGNLFSLMLRMGRGDLADML